MVSNYGSNDEELWEACRTAMQMQALNLDLNERFDEILDRNLQNAVQPVASKRGKSVDQLMAIAQQIIKTDQTFAMALDAARKLDEMQRQLSGPPRRRF